MKIKKKLLLGFGLLFIIVLIFGAISVYYIKVISETANVTLKNNYKTLTFTREMRSVLDENDLPLSSGSANVFDQALQKQENNITEPGEKAATDSLRQAFTSLTDQASDLNQKQQAERNARLQLKQIEGLNMHAIELKNEYTHSTVNKATLYLGSTAFITFFILFILIVNFPGFILNPLRELADGLDQIGEKNYDTRLKFNTSEEFTQLAEAFNTMAGNLGERENDNLTKVIAAESRIKMLIEEMRDAVLGVNEKQELLFINHEAKKILNLGEKPVIGQSVLELSKDHPLLKVILENNDHESPLKINQDGKVLYFQQNSFEVVVPNLKTDLDSLQVAGYSVGTIQILKKTKG
ncbi:HAMP domain-containing protein [Mucilaginibacter sp. Mucisp86]|uniref:HAMP domain-containing protein n=1 Tax=Mucilaginibacter sp. Mucisp86 TaxID=3243060 RepID=UPI0039B3D3E1